MKQVTAVVEQVSVRQANEYVVKTKRERVNIPKHLSVQVECHVHMESPQEDATLIFEADVNPRWTERLELCDMLVGVRKKKALYYCKCAKSHRSRHSVSRENCFRQ